MAHGHIIGLIKAQCRPRCRPRGSLPHRPPPRGAGGGGVGGVEGACSSSGVSLSTENTMRSLWSDGEGGEAGLTDSRPNYYSEPNNDNKPIVTISLQPQVADVTPVSGREAPAASLPYPHPPPPPSPPPRSGTCNIQTVYRYFPQFVRLQPVRFTQYPPPNWSNVGPFTLKIKVHRAT